MERLMFGASAQKHIDAYAEYHNIVGNADGGKMFTEKEYEEYKEYLRKNQKNKVYGAWQNANGVDCKLFGPATKCTCDHRFRDHNYINPVNKKVKCNTSGCDCKCFFYIPVHGSQDMKCLCKHSYKDHDNNSMKCKKAGCKCSGLSSSWSCTCNMTFNEHRTVFETADERKRSGKLINDMALGAGGNLPSFTALVDGAERFENQDWGPTRQHYQQKMLEGDMSRLALEDDKKLGSLGVAGKGQLSAQSQKKDGPKTALDLYNTPHSFGRKSITSTTKKFLTRKPVGY